MEYALKPQTVVDTLWARYQKGDSRIFSLSGADSPLMLGTSPAEKESLFVLAVAVEGGPAVLRTPVGELKGLRVGEAPDPLWESAEGICAHMDADHADTYPEFLRMKSLPVVTAPLSMPWVEQRGFFLQHQSEGGPRFHWIAFPAPCPTANDVRKTLIQMLRGSRDE